MKSNTEWRDWGRRDPLYGVSTWPGRSREDASPWTDEEFYAIGAADWVDFERQWREYGLRDSSCLEIGCGSGRITSQLVQVFARVVAVDVSPEMIDYAREHGTNRAEYHLVDGVRLPAKDGEIAAMFSVLVFQHFDHVTDGERLFAEAFRVLEPGGTIMIQVPVYAWPGDFVGYRALYRVRRGFAAVRASIRRWRLKRGSGQPFFRYLRYEAVWLEHALLWIGYVDVQLRTFKPTVHPEWLTFVLARKPTL